jgi:hypothetical protein
MESSMFRPRPLLLLLLALILPARSALAKDPILTILLTGNTEGHYAPCPS